MPTRRSLERINPSCNFAGTRFSSSSVMVQHIMANNYTPKLAGRILFYALIAFLAFGLMPWRVFSQAAGYTKLNTSPVTSLTFTDSGVTDGAIYQYQVTAFCSGTACGNDSNGHPILGESTPLTFSPAVIPASGTHSATLTWNASTTLGVTYNVYRIQAVPPNPPVAGSATVSP